MLNPTKPEPDDFGYGTDESGDNPELANNGDFVFIERVPITISGDIVVDIYSSQEIPKTTSLELDLHKLYAAINIDDRSPGQRFLDEELVPIKPIPETWEPNEDTRGPYYGLDQLTTKLSGMQAAYNYIEAIYVDDSDILPVWYIVFPAGDKNRKRSGTKKRR